MIIIASNNVDESQFMFYMESADGMLFSQEALRMIYADLKNREERKDKEIVFLSANVVKEYKETECHDFLTEWDLEADLTSDTEIERVIKAFFKGHSSCTLLGFTKEKTAVYQVNRLCDYVTIT